LKHFDEVSTTQGIAIMNPKTNSLPMRELIEQSLSRRSFVHILTSGACVAALTELDVHASAPETRKTSQMFQFRSIPPSIEDRVVVPEGYTAEVLYRWGDPINGESPAFQPNASNSADEQEKQAGMGHDGMEFFPLPGIDPNERGLLAINHEYTDQILLFADGIEPLPPQPMPMEKVRKSIASHGVSIVEIAKQKDGRWQVVKSPRARRITADTPMSLAGPAKDKLGTEAKGTVNNCAAGRTPWGTYLTCEENFQGVFGTNASGFQPTTAQKAYGLSAEGFFYTINQKKVPGYRWWEQLPRFDLSQPNNDSERFGYVVEIDPYDPTSKPVKRTALGRFRHENAELTVAPDGRVVVYMGDDEMDQYVYKFVSEGKWDPTSIAGTGVLETSGLLDKGTLYAARFNADGTGTWLELAPGVNNIPRKSSPTDTEGFDAADIAIHSRMAAKIAGATPMDRPEWLAVHPETKEVYVTLTNNKSRHATDAANPRAKNIFGHIVRWKETNDDATSTQFNWQIFVLAGNPKNADSTNHGNTKGDFFACPDGLKFDASGVLWIQTDMSSSVMGKEGYAELGHNMMLAADPITGETRRFLTGPRGCEITGNAMTPDRKTMFVNIQHPGEPADDLSDPNMPLKVSSWPDGPNGGRPRSATIVIRKQDGGFIGS
jgi:secreted PhoX family phosphatase